MDHTYDNIVAGNWTKEQANNYLQQQALNETIKTSVWRTAQHNMYWEDYITKAKTEEQLLLELGDDVFEVIKAKGKIPLDKPATWDRAQPLALNVDVIMHLLFLGVWSTLVAQGAEWLRLKQMESSFILYAEGLLEKIQALNLSYCRVLGYKKGKLGGWVSENYLGFSRVGGWFYGHFGSTKKTAERQPYKEPNKPQEKWTKKENEAWLAARRLPRKGNAKELSAEVAKLLASEGGPPEVVEIEGGGCELFLAAVNGFLRLVSVVMQDFMNEELLLEMEFRVKVFLTLFEDFDSKMRAPKDKPKAVTTYNFFSLLNLPVSAGLLGPLRNVWEGGPKGEGYLQQIKGALNSGLRPGWEMKVMNTIYRNIGLSNVLNTWTRTDQGIGLDDDGNGPASNAGRFYKYKSLPILLTHYEQGSPISCLRFTGGQFGCVVGDSLDVYEVQIHLGKKRQMLNEMAYVEWVVVKESRLGRLPKGESTDSDNYLKIKFAVLLLPLLSETGGPKEGHTGVYTAVTDEWTKLTMGGGFVRY